MDAIAFQITSLAIVYSTVYSGAVQRKHQCSAALMADEFSAQISSNAQNVTIWWRHHVHHTSLCIVVNLHSDNTGFKKYSRFYLHLSWTSTSGYNCMYYTGQTLGLRPANERRRYFVTTSLIGWVQALNQPSAIQYNFLTCIAMQTMKYMIFGVAVTYQIIQMIANLMP